MSNENSKEREIQYWQQMALIWEFRFLNLDLPRGSQGVLFDVSRSVSSSLTEETFGQEFATPIATSPTDPYINVPNMFSALLYYGLLDKYDGEHIRVSEKGLKFLKFFKYIQ